MDKSKADYGVREPPYTDADNKRGLWHRCGFQLYAIFEKNGTVPKYRCNEIDYAWSKREWPTYSDGTPARHSYYTCFEKDGFELDDGTRISYGMTITNQATLHKIYLRMAKMM